MSVVVEPTIPYSPAVLDLENPWRWNALLPSIRPSVVPVHTAKGQTILVDLSHASKEDVHIAVIGKLGNFSSKLLDDKDVTAIVTEQHGADLPTANDIARAINQAGMKSTQGMIILRAGRQARLESLGSDIFEVETNGELELDHLLHLLGRTTASCRASIHQTTELVQIFLDHVSTTYSRFDTEKTTGCPAVIHVDGSQVFEKARHAIEKDMKHVLRYQTAQHGSVVFSAHFSDLNGLSRLENYILAAEIGQLLEGQGLAYKLSHSTILDHNELARGFAISICAVPSHYLASQPKADVHERGVKPPETPQTVETRQSSVMSFDDAQVRRRIIAGCEAVIKAEPTITEYDTIVGDGDCGYTLRDGAKQVLQFIKDKDLSRPPQVVSELVHSLEVNMGGTSGALYCIYLTALASSLSTEATVAKALHGALQELLKYTRARLGDRTMMDALIPFIDTLVATGDVRAAVSNAREGVDQTKRMQAQLGRSSYLDESATQGVPDPGAYGLLILLEGMSQ